MTSWQGFITVQITQEMRDTAQEYAQKLADYQNNTWNIFGGAMQQKLTGELGRLALRKYLQGAKVEFKEQVVFGRMDEYDFIIGGAVVSLKTICSRGTPRETWRCEVNEKQLKNPCNVYVFAAEEREGSVVRLVGGISKERFESEGTLRRAGEIVDAGAEQWTVKETKKDILIGKLTPVAELVMALSNKESRVVESSITVRQ